MRKVRVLIVEDSMVCRNLLRHIIGRDPRLEVAAAVESGEEALRIVAKIQPDVISLDIRLPGMDGFEVTRRVMSTFPIPIVVVSASIESEDLKIAMRALEAGALSVVEKPVGETRPEYEALANRLCTQLAIMSEVGVIRQRFPREIPAVRASVSAERNGFQVLGIAASTGGPHAVQELLCGLDREFPLPILLVQHLPPSFLTGFAEWLAGACPFPVEVVQTRLAAVPGKVYVAAPGLHLRASIGWACAEPGAEVNASVPSATVLFESLAKNLGVHALGVLLTGMGEDGAAGLLELRRAGGYTIAEDKSTAVVYGMPAAAERLGAVEESLPLPAIARRVMELTRTGGGCP